MLFKRLSKNKRVGKVEVWEGQIVGRRGTADPASAINRDQTA